MRLASTAKTLEQHTRKKLHISEQAKRFYRMKLRFFRLYARWSLSHCRYPWTLPIFSP